MPKTVVQLSQIYEFKLIISTKSLIWYKHPISQFSTARLNLYDTTVNLGFGNHATLGIKQVEYRIADSLQLARFYQEPLLIQVVNFNDGKNGGECVGYVQLDPRLITEKTIIAPILSSSCSQIKLGDIEVQFKLSKSATDITQLRQINSSLQQMISKCPGHFDNLYCKLRREGYICGHNCR